MELLRYTHTMKSTTPNNLRELRQNAGLRQIDVAIAIGLRNSDRISEWELGLRHPNIVNLFKLAKMFGVTADALYPSLLENDRGALGMQ